MPGQNIFALCRGGYSLLHNAQITFSAKISDRNLGGHSAQLSPIVLLRVYVLYSWGRLRALGVSWWTLAAWSWYRVFNHTHNRNPGIYTARNVKSNLSSKARALRCGKLWRLSALYVAVYVCAARPNWMVIISISWWHVLVIEWIKVMQFNCVGQKV